jgi:hypothetical protein
MRSFVTCVLAVSLLITSAPAQSGDWASVESLAPGTDISVTTARGRKCQGEFDSATPERLILWSQERDFPGRKLVRREIPRVEIKQVRLNHRVASVAAGAAIGAGLGIGIGAAIDSQYRSNEDRGLLSVVLGLLGGAMGAAIAKTHPFIKGKIIYRVP